MTQLMALRKTFYKRETLLQGGKAGLLTLEVQKYGEVHRSTQKYKEVRRSTKKYREVHGSTREVPFLSSFFSHK